MNGLTPEERKQAYITLVQEEYKPVKYKWWKSTGRIHYHFTKDLARDNYKRIDRVGPVEFRKGKIGAYIAAGFLILSILGTFFIDRMIGFFAFLVVLIFFGLALPRLLDKKVRIRITREGIWTEGLTKEISWENVLITCIKEVDNGEDSVLTLIIHFYDPISDQFLNVERGLDEISVYHVSATIEFFKSEYIPSY